MGDVSNKNFPPFQKYIKIVEVELDSVAIYRTLGPVAERHRQSGLSHFHHFFHTNVYDSNLLQKSTV